MTGPSMPEYMAEALAELETQKSALAAAQREWETVTATVISKNRALEVTVNGHGEVTDVKFPTGSFRTMAPAELGKLLVQTIGQAQGEARDRTATLFASVMPQRLPIAGILAGDLDFGALMAEMANAGEDEKEPRT